MFTLKGTITLSIEHIDGVCEITRVLREVDLWLLSLHDPLLIVFINENLLTSTEYLSLSNTRVMLWLIMELQPLPSHVLELPVLTVVDGIGAAYAAGDSPQVPRLVRGDVSVLSLKFTKGDPAYLL